MSGSSDFFIQFLTTVNSILYCPDTHTVLTALQSLAGGREASIHGTHLGPLSGLGQHTTHGPSDLNYRTAMTNVLEWGLGNFPVEPSHTRIHLWEVMTAFDGPRGYNRW